METNFSQAEREADYTAAEHALNRYNHWLRFRNQGQRYVDGEWVDGKLDKHRNVHVKLARKYGTSHMFGELLLVIKDEPVPVICE